MKILWKYLLANVRYARYVGRHKWYVFRACLQTRRPRLIWAGLIHDWSKFLPDEWGPYVMQFYMPLWDEGVASRYMMKHGRRERFLAAWMKHKSRNPHHWEYWLHVNNGEVEPVRMPDHYAREMVCDWRGAGMAQGKPDTKAWYLTHYKNILLHPHTRILVNHELGVTVDDLGRTGNLFNDYNHPAAEALIEILGARRDRKK